MTNMTDKQYIDPENSMERDINDCKVRLFFSPTPNEKSVRLVLDNLMLAFDRKVQRRSGMQT